MSSKNGEALEIINYWKLIEFLNQKDFTFGRDGGNKYNGKKKKTVITHIHNIYSLQSLTDIGSLIENDDEEFKGFSGEKADPKDAEIHYCFGGIKRNDFVDYLAKYNKDISLNPEYSASDNTFFAAFSFKTDLKGNYVKESIQISPLLWAVSVWKKNGAFQTREFSLQIEEYKQTRKKLDIEIQKNKDVEGCHISQFIEELFQNVVDDYVKPQFTYEKAKRNGKTRIGAWSYRRFPSEKDQEKSSSYDYSTLFNSYIADDLELFGNALASGQFGDGSEYEKRMIEYVLSASYKEKKGDFTSAADDFSERKSARNESFF
ncbi:MAG: hypothetical protein LUH00_07990 [Lachnospiraceae bacterium]|nr:hypothetical protein [Lachnospiraceae bacterium]